MCLSGSNNCDLKLKCPLQARVLNALFWLVLFCETRTFRSCCAADRSRSLEVGGPLKVSDTLSGFRYEQPLPHAPAAMV